MIGDKSLVDRFSETFETDNPVEKELLAGMLQAQSSLFEVQEINAENSTLRLFDLLADTEPFEIVDLGLSQSLKAPNRPLVFTRIIRLEPFNMTTGLGFIFSPNHKDYLLSRSRKMIKKLQIEDPAIKRLRVFFHLNRKEGLPSSFDHVR